MPHMKWIFNLQPNQNKITQPPDNAGGNDKKHNNNKSAYSTLWFEQCNWKINHNSIFAEFQCQNGFDKATWDGLSFHKNVKASRFWSLHWNFLLFSNSKLNSGSCEGESLPSWSLRPLSQSKTFWSCIWHTGALNSKYPNPIGNLIQSIKV